MAKLWTRVEYADLVIDWVDRGNRRTFRDGQDGTVLEFVGDTLTIAPRIPMSPAMIKGLAFWFIPIATVACAIFLPFPARWIAGLFVPILGYTMILFTHLWQQHRLKVGPYLVANLKDRTIHLPRIRQTVSFDSVRNFQWIHGYYIPGWANGKLGPCYDGARELATDLNLIVECEDGTIARYFVMDYPDRHVVRRLIKTRELPLVEVRPSMRGRVDIDKNHPSVRGGELADQHGLEWQPHGQR